MTSPPLESIVASGPSSREDLRRVINPATGHLSTTWRQASVETVDRAIEDAARAQAQWAQVPRAERAALLREVAHLIDEDAQGFAADDSRENGRLLRSLLDDDVPSAAAVFRDAAERLLASEPVKENVDGGVLLHARVPHGVCAGIGAWNYPLACAAAKIAPALACGNAIVFKPAPQTPSSAHRLGTVLRRLLCEGSSEHAGLCSIVLGDEQVGQRLVSHPRVRFVSVTGSVATGQRVFAAGASGIKRFVLELGGKSALIVLEDADLDTAVDVALHANYVAHGQLCTAASRVYIHRSLFDAFRDRFVRRVQGLIVGPPDEDTSEIGPLVSVAHARSVRKKVAAAIARGANVCCGDLSDEQTQHTDAYVAPVVIDRIAPNDPLLSQEIFGPVACLLPFDSVEEAISNANAVAYGLAAGVVSKDVDTATRLAGRLRAGVVWVNSYNDQPLEMAFGGMGCSGVGREGGALGFAAYSEQQSIFVGQHSATDNGFAP